VVCQLDELQKCAKLSELREALKVLPKTLDATYERILLKIDEVCRGDVQKVLLALTFSKRPLTLEEVVEILAVTFEGGPRFDPEQRYPEPRDILTRCSSLVSLSAPSSGNNPVEGQLQLAHFSVKEYLISDRIRDGPAHQYGVTQRCADIFIAQACLAYLLQFQTPDCLVESMTKDFPLAVYASGYWIDHASPHDDTNSNELHSLILELFQPSRVHYLHWSQIYFEKSNRTHGVFVPFDYVHKYSVILPLYHTSDAGMTQTSRLLLENGADPNAQCGWYGNALQAASLKGHHSIVQLLLDKGADPNAHHTKIGSALCAAAHKGHVSIVKLLLDRGADPNVASRRYGNALQAALWDKSETIVQLLLDKGADPNAHHTEIGSALCAVTHEEPESIVKLLLDRGANPNAHHTGIGSALCTAAYKGHVSIVKLLLDRGADPNVADRLYGNALQAASWNTNETIVQLLLDKGADPNAQGGYYGNALQAASLNGHEVIVQLLLDKGADPNAQGGYFGNALHAASLKGHKVIVQLLLQKGAISHNNLFNA